MSAASSPSHAPRVVSLVPSASETLVALGVMPIACTRFCELAGVPTIGGTKRPDVRAIVHLAPDLVVVNDEENRWDDATALIDAGLAVHSMSPRSVVLIPPGYTTSWYSDDGACIGAIASKCAGRSTAAP